MEINDTKSKITQILTYLIPVIILLTATAIMFTTIGPVPDATETISLGTVLLVGLLTVCLSLLLLYVSVTNHTITLRLEERLASNKEPGQNTDIENLDLEIPEAISHYRASRNLSDETAKVPSVLVSSELLNQLADGLSQFRRQNQDLETGYTLVGKVTGQGINRKIMVQGLIEPGEQLDCSMYHVTHDRDNDQGELELFQLIDPHVCHIGDAHLHPGAMDVCSDGDYQTDLGNVQTSTTGEMIFMIATLL